MSALFVSRFCRWTKVEKKVRRNVQKTGSSLACPQYHHHHRDQAHSRLTSAITAPQTPRWRPPATGDCAGQPLIGTRRAALLGTCARARAPRRDAPSKERMLKDNRTVRRSFVPRLDAERRWKLLYQRRLELGAVPGIGEENAL